MRISRFFNKRNLAAILLIALCTFFVLAPKMGNYLELTAGNIADVDRFIISDGGYDGITKTYTWASLKTDLGADSFSLSTLNLTALTGEPTEVVGQIYRADNDNWDPAGIAGVVDYFVICTAADTYIPLFDIAGIWYVSSIGMPTLEENELSDSASTPTFTLTEAELKNKKISNAGSGGTRTYQMPEHTTQDDWNLMFICEDAQNMNISPHANDAYTLNGLAAAAGEDIVNEACTAGESIILYSTEVGVFLESKYTDWVEDTPPI